MGYFPDGPMNPQLPPQHEEDGARIPQSPYEPRPLPPTNPWEPIIRPDPNPQPLPSWPSEAGNY